MGLWSFSIYTIIAAVITIGHNCESSPVKKSAADSTITSMSKTELGMAKKQEKVFKLMAGQPMRRVRRTHYSEHSELEDDQDHGGQLVTIDLSALRPSLPGLVLYKYGEMAPKLVQIDLDALNPELQPHVVWPEFQQQLGDLGEEFFDVVSLDNGGAIPYLTEGDSLSPSYGRPQMAKMMAGRSDWPNMDDLAESDMYDFLPNSLRNEELMSLHQTLPLADEVIVPLDWEEDDGNKRHHETSDREKSKKNVFVSQGWTPGGQLRPHHLESATKQAQRSRSRGARVVMNKMPHEITYTSPFGSSGWRPGKRQFEGATDEDGILEGDVDSSIEKEGGEPNTEADFTHESTVSKTHTVTSARKKNLRRFKGREEDKQQSPSSSDRIHKSNQARMGSNSRPPATKGQEPWMWTPQQWAFPQMYTNNNW